METDTDEDIEGGDSDGHTHVRLLRAVPQENAPTSR